MLDSREVRNVRVLASLFDELQVSLLRYTNFLAKSRALVLTRGVHVPPLRALLLTYHLDLDAAFVLERTLNAALSADPVAAALAHAATLTEAQLLPADAPLTPEFFALFWTLQLRDIVVRPPCLPVLLARRSCSATVWSLGADRGVRAAHCGLERRR
jgi:hypothetical protein